MQAAKRYIHWHSIAQLQSFWLQNANLHASIGVLHCIDEKNCSIVMATENIPAIAEQNPLQQKVGRGILWLTNCFLAVKGCFGFQLKRCDERRFHHWSWGPPHNYHRDQHSQSRVFPAGLVKHKQLACSWNVLATKSWCFCESTFTHPMAAILDMQQLTLLHISINSCVWLPSKRKRLKNQAPT